MLIGLFYQLGATKATFFLRTDNIHQRVVNKGKAGPFAHSESVFNVQTKPGNTFARITTLANTNCCKILKISEWFFKVRVSRV